MQRVLLVGLPLSVLSTRMARVHSLAIMVAVFGFLVLRLGRLWCAVFRRVVSCSERSMAVFMWAAYLFRELVILFSSLQTGQTARHRDELAGFSRAGCWYGWLLLPSASLPPDCTNAARHAGPMRARPASAPTAVGLPASTPKRCNMDKRAPAWDTASSAIAKGTAPCSPRADGTDAAARTSPPRHTPEQKRFR